MARDVFISYSQPDHTCAFELVARLEAEGINCWIAPRDIAPSADWAAEIMDAISSVRVMILVFSANSNLSPQVRREVERDTTQKKKKTKKKTQTHNTTHKNHKNNHKPPPQPH